MPAGDATRIGRTLASRLKELLDRQQYEVVIQVGFNKGGGWGSAGNAAGTGVICLTGLCWVLDREGHSMCTCRLDDRQQYEVLRGTLPYAL